MISVAESKLLPTNWRNFRIRTPNSPQARVGSVRSTQYFNLTSESSMGADGDKYRVFWPRTSPDDEPRTLRSSL